MPQNANLEAQIAFLVEVDKLKSVLRRNYAIHGDRRENSAEHSWHVALFAMVLAEHSNEPVDINRVVKMLVIHDIVEVDAGDTFIYDDAGKETQVAREKRAADRLFGLLPQKQGELFRHLWEEFEAAATPRRSLQKQSIGSPPPYTTIKRMVAGGVKMASDATVSLRLMSTSGAAQPPFGTKFKAW